jgi:hypothetical protein
LRHVWCSIARATHRALERLPWHRCDALHGAATGDQHRTSVVHCAAHGHDWIEHEPLRILNQGCPFRFQCMRIERCVTLRHIESRPFIARSTPRTPSTNDTRSVLQPLNTRPFLSNQSDQVIRSTRESKPFLLALGTALRRRNHHEMRALSGGGAKSCHPQR